MIDMGMWMQHGVVEGAFQVHDSAVHDVAFGAETVFATCSADGSARILDCRFVLMHLFRQLTMFLLGVVQHSLEPK